VLTFKYCTEQTFGPEYKLFQSSFTGLAAKSILVTFKEIEERIHSHALPSESDEEVSKKLLSSVVSPSGGKLELAEHQVSNLCDILWGAGAKDHIIKETKNTCQVRDKVKKRYGPWKNKEKVIKLFQSTIQSVWWNSNQGITIQRLLLH